MSTASIIIRYMSLGSKKDDLKLNNEKLFYYGTILVVINLWIIPIILWIAIDFNYALEYFWKFSLGIPYIILSIGSFWFYKARIKGEQTIKVFNKRVDDAKNIVNKGGKLDILIAEEKRRNEKIVQIEKNIELKETCDRLGYILRAGAIVFAMYFFLRNDSKEAVSLPNESNQINANLKMEEMEQSLIDLNSEFIKYKKYSKNKMDSLELVIKAKIISKGPKNSGY